jgi:hypothetical protein
MKEALMTTSVAEPSVATELGGLKAERQETWAASRASNQKQDKSLMAHHFANHDFLLQEGSNPAHRLHDTAASFLVNQGTSPNVVVQESLQWIAEHAQQGPFHITWYSPGALVPATLFEFRQRHPHLSAATHVHLFPGTIDLQLQAQTGTEAQEYARSIRRRFSYMILSGHSFDLRTGVVRFHFEREVPLQKTCALLEATQKFLFFDNQKFTGEGEVGYSLRELLATCNAVVIYTVSSPRSDEIKAAFDALGGALLAQISSDAALTEPKTLRLTIVGSGNIPSENYCYKGFLRPDGSAAQH